MKPDEHKTHQHQVGITNSQEKNPDNVIADFTRRMKMLFKAGQYAEAVCIAMQITAISKDDLRKTFECHDVDVKRLDHEVFGIYRGELEPSYDILVEGNTDSIQEAAEEFGKRHKQEMILIARKSYEGEKDPRQGLGLTITLNEKIDIETAVEIAELVRNIGFQGATFVPKGNGTIIIYNAKNLGLSPDTFQRYAEKLLEKLIKRYNNLSYDVQQYILITLDLCPPRAPTKK